MITGVDDQKYTELLQLQSADLNGATPFCPEDQVIAEYFDGELAETELGKLERHLTDCRFCLARIGMLERHEHKLADYRIPGAVLATAKQIKHQTPVSRPRLAPAWAAAAVVVIGLFIVIGRDQDLVPEPGTAPPMANSTEADSGQLRSIRRDVANINVLSPTPGAHINPGALIHWTDIPDNLHYNIFVLSNEGDVLWTERVATNEWTLLDSMQLTAGSNYYFRVEAHLPDGRSLSSKHLAFGIAKRR